MTRKKVLRHKAIIDELGSSPSMRVGELSVVLGVTKETIRRDLEELSEQNVISRTYGGAVLRQPSEAVLSERHKEKREERSAMAKVAVPLLKGAKTIMIGSGATTVHVAKRIAFEMNNITVITHSFGVATVLSLNPTIKVIMAPGEYYASEGAVHGAQAVRFLSELSADWAILGASGITSTGPSDALMEAADVYRSMIAQSECCMITADHTKFDRQAIAQFSHWSDIDFLITDKVPSEPLRKQLVAESVDIKLTTP
ncbi:DeoR/GlpR transcriptional regulator [Marinomonas sp. A79]|uniref:DeoR/GlpR transcriptional regulator n=1 Tax=Marinomonas vulgaris TaxID=2823372 RepID=A0ABS5HF69_9GAMM|nr:DeoR/GlpR family DNA-binding transcription regulator [Marinomonas vulgaris]MBR7890276.1 DeoR/GlpR transcriptional regulator [Marinomonas vulgaris]